MPRGPVRPTPTPDHSGTDDDRKGGPLWLRLQGYVLPVILCQDQLRVSATGVLVTTRTGSPCRSTVTACLRIMRTARVSTSPPQWRPYRRDEIRLSLWVVGEVALMTGLVGRQ